MYALFSLWPKVDLIKVVKTLTSLAVIYAGHKKLQAIQYWLQNYKRIFSEMHENWTFFQTS